MSGEHDTGGISDLPSFGRKRGRKPSPRQSRLLDEALPRWRINLDTLTGRPLADVFDGAVREVWLEIGFGGAEHLIHQARLNPDVGLIGCEPFEEGIIKALSAVEEEGLRTVRLHPDDARPLLRALPAGQVARMFVLYPDPWPKARHAKRRLVSKPFLDLAAHALAPGALLRIATDIPAYARTVLEVVMGHPAFEWTATCPADWETAWPDWPGTRYEAKALREGRRPIYLTFVRQSA